MKHDEIIAQLTLFEKAALLHGKNMWQTWDIKGLPSSFLVDGPHGLRKQAGSADILGINPSLPATCFPTASCLANSWDEGLLEEVGTALGVEAAALDVSVLLGPGLNIKRSPLCGRNFEYFSEDPVLAGKMAAGLIRGIQSIGVAACPKHFAVNSQELLRMSSNSVVDERTLHEIYLTGFEIAVKEGKPKSIMSSYNKINGEYAHENYHLLTEILRGEWGFDGAVISDWGGLNDAVASAKNGGTLEMPGGGLDSARQIVRAVESGELSEETLNRRVDEVIELVLSTSNKVKPKVDTKNPITGSQGSLGANENTLQQQHTPSACAGVVDFDKHHAIARKAAERSIVLLKNEGGILPLKEGAKVVFIGEFAVKPRFQGAGSSQVNAFKTDAAVDVIKQTRLNLADAPENADLILFYLGLDDTAESEGLDRTHIKLPQSQLDLLDKTVKLGKPIVAVVTAGAVIDMSWTDKVQGVVHGFLHGQAGAGAILDVLTGKVNPSGKLAETYPLKLEDTPAFGLCPAETPNAQYREGLFVGYRHFETRNIPAAFPFGFGLSYTMFAYSELTIRKSGASFTITNTGAVDGDEIAQLYVKKSNSTLIRPAVELKGFKRVFVKAGESAAVTIPFDAMTFRYFSVETGKWEIESGDYEVIIGTNVKDTRLSEKIFIKGTYNEKAPPKEISWDDGEEWLKNGLFASNNALRQSQGCKSLILRLLSRIVYGRTQKAGKDGRPDLNMIFVYNMPFRAFARNAGKVFSTEMVDGIVTIANGHIFPGIGRLAAGFLRNRKLNKQGERQLRGVKNNGD